MLFPGVALISCIFTVLFYFTGFVSRIYLIPVAFVINFLLLFLCWALSCVICTRFVDIKKPCKKHSPIFRFYANCIIDSLMQILRIKLHITGLGKLPEEKFLLVGNHRSAMDPILEMGVLRKYNIGFVAKKELYRIPVIGRIMHKCFCLSLDRESLREGMKTMNKTADYIKQQTASIGIFPEGTRSRDNKLLPFKNGAFKIAQKADCPIVVAVIRNSELIMKNAPFKRTDVYIDFVGVLNAEDILHSKTEQIGERVRTMMESAMAHS